MEVLTLIAAAIACFTGWLSALLEGNNTLVATYYVGLTVVIKWSFDLVRLSNRADDPEDGGGS